MESRKKHLHLPHLVLVLCLGGCDQEDITISSSHPQIDFTLAKTNSDDDYISRASTVQLSNQIMKWYDHGGEIWLMRELHYEVTGWYDLCGMRYDVSNGSFIGLIDHVTPYNSL